MSVLSLEEKLQIIQNSSSLGELPLDAMPYTQSDEYYFVSYSHLDYKFVYQDILKLQSCGINVWYDRGLPAGQNWEDMAHEALSKYACAGVIFYISTNSLLSDAVQNEIAFVKKLGKSFLSINMPMTTSDGNQKICSAQDMLEEIEKTTTVSPAKKQAVCEAFSNKIIYLGYDESTDKKAEKIKLLKKPDLLVYEPDDTLMFDVIKAGGVVLKSVNSLDAKHIEVPARVLVDGKEQVVTRIGDCAFANCKNLQTIKINGKIDVGKYAFFGCTSLEKIEGESIGKVDEKAFLRCDNLATLPMLDGEVFDNAFCGCHSLQEVKLGNEFYSRAQGIFEDSGITFVDRHEQEECYTYTRSNLFDCCFDWLVSYKRTSFDSFEKDCMLLFARPDKKGLLGTPYRTNRITGGFLADKTALKTMEIGADVYCIEANAFANCNNLEQVVFAPDGKDSLEIKEKAFFKTQKLNTLCLPANLSKIETKAFARSGLKTICFDKNCRIETIDEYVFSHCNNLVEIVLPPNLKKIEKYAFEYCSSLEQITIPASVTSLASLAFAGCKNLKKLIFAEGTKTTDHFNLRYMVADEIVLPASITNVDLAKTNKNTKITFLGTKQQWQSLVDGQTCDNVVYCADGIFNQ